MVKLRRAMSIGALLLSLLGLAQSLHGQSPLPLQWRPCVPDQVQVLLLGVFHMANDDVLVDVRSPRRQAELDTLVSRLATFRPSKLAVERPYTTMDSLNVLYRGFRAQGGSPTNPNEVWQIGFRLARFLGVR
jgi:hypothetical protein